MIVLLLQLLLSKDGVFIHVTTAQADEDVLLPGQVVIWNKVDTFTVSALSCSFTNKHYLFVVKWGLGWAMMSNTRAVHKVNLLKQKVDKRTRLFF